MCENCGCEDGGGYTIINPADHNHQHGNSHADSKYDGDHIHAHDHSQDHNHDHAHHHDHDHVHDHDHEHKRISIETDVLHRNNLLAQRNRGYFEARNISCLNLVSSPGSGKTTLLERTIRQVSGRNIYVIEGDQQTSLDAERIQATGVPVLQVNTGTGCHLDAGMINHAVKTMNPLSDSLLLIENVGNLVCPALFDLGEKQRVLIISITEGEDKPLKYPHMFGSAHICLINKIDLQPYLDFNIELFKSNALKVNRNLQFFELSARTGEGFDSWIGWLLQSASDK
jgi:hydrogenase nickel incorporation protein HypB